VLLGLLVEILGFHGLWPTDRHPMIQCNFVVVSWPVLARMVTTKSFSRESLIVETRTRQVKFTSYREGWKMTARIIDGNEFLGLERAEQSSESRSATEYKCHVIHHRYVRYPDHLQIARPPHGLEDHDLERYELYSDLEMKLTIMLPFVPFVGLEIVPALSETSEVIVEHILYVVDLEAFILDAGSTVLDSREGWVSEAPTRAEIDERLQDTFSSGWYDLGCEISVGSSCLPEDLWGKTGP